jgi:hypothetical protein
LTTISSSAAPTAGTNALREFVQRHDVEVVGGAIAELIVHGRYDTLDLGRLGYRRIEQNAPYPDRGIL